VGERVRVQVRLVPWFGDLAAPGQGQTVVLEEEVQAGSSLRSLLTRLAGRYAGFQEAVYSPGAGRLEAGVVVAHNGRLVAASEALDLRLEDGGVISLVPPTVGG
jgi:sulfur carrier protein ThiS